MNKTQNMTIGNPFFLIGKFAIPLLLGTLFQQCYNLIDTIIVGRSLGINALASVGASSSMLFMVQGFCIGTCAGFGVPIAQEFGAGLHKVMRKYVSNSLYLSAIIAVIITLITALFCRQILVLLKTPELILDGAYIYLLIIFLGMPFTILYNIAASIIRAIGDSRTPFVFLVYSTFLNIGLDLLFILVFHMGVAGAALATILAQGLSGLLCLRALLQKYEVLKFEKDELAWNTEFVGKLLFMGIPMGLQSSITAIGSVMLQSAVNSLGEVSVAAYTAAMKIKLFFISPFDSLGTALATYAGQNLGAGKIERIGKGLRSSAFMVVVYALFAFLILFAGSKWMIMLFVDSSESAVILQAREYITDISIFFAGLGFLFLFRYSIQGMGHSRLAICSGVMEMIARTIMSLAVIPSIGWTGACFTDPIAWLAADFFLVPSYLLLMRKTKRKCEKLKA